MHNIITQGGPNQMVKVGHAAGIANSAYLTGSISSPSFTRRVSQFLVILVSFEIQSFQSTRARDFAHFAADLRAVSSRSLCSLARLFRLTTRAVCLRPQR
jgi:hypothetical protein